MSESLSTSKPPNIIFILIDDLGWTDLGCFGSEFYETPNIDGLAKEGIKFTEAYAASPVCSPTRASILTGKNPGRLGTTQYFGGTHSRGKHISARTLNHLPLEEVTIASALLEGGYNTFHIGKWHLGKPPYTPENHGFQINIGGCHWGAPLFGYFSPYRNPILKDGPKGEYLTDRLTDEAIKLIKKNKDSPFFLHLSYHSVHIPIQAPQDLINKYKLKAKELNLNSKQTFLKGEKFSCTHKKYNHVMRRILQSDPVYAAMIERLDWNIGRILESVKELGLIENSIIIFFSDNGGLSTAEGSPTCNAPLNEGKGWLDEGGTRVPLIIKWPNKIKEGKICNYPIVSMDFYPTILNMAGLPLRPDQHIDGTSFISLLKSDDIPEEKPLFWHYPHYSNQGDIPGSSVRLGKYKLIEHFETEEIELYDLEEDISEQNNLVEKKPEIAEKLKKLLNNWRLEIDAKLSKPNPNYNRLFGDIKAKLLAKVMWAYSRFSSNFKNVRKTKVKRTTN